MPDDFSRCGVCAFTSAVSAEDVELLRRDCGRLRANYEDEALCELSCVLEAEDALLMHSRCDGEEYLVTRGTPAADRDSMRALLLCKLPALVIAALDSASAVADLRLFNEHFVVKPARIASSFRWHTDAAHQLEALCAVAGAHNLPEYVSVWIPLDDLHGDGSNGALTLLPLDAPQPPDGDPMQPASAAAERWLHEHARGHVLSSRGLRAGDAIIFSSRLWHMSEPNLSACERRVHYSQYSIGPIGGAAAPLALAVPVARGHAGAEPPPSLQSSSLRRLRPATEECGKRAREVTCSHA